MVCQPHSSGPMNTEWRPALTPQGAAGRMQASSSRVVSPRPSTADDKTSVGPCAHVKEKKKLTPGLCK